MFILSVKVFKRHGLIQDQDQVQVQSLKWVDKSKIRTINPYREQALTSTSSTQDLFRETYDQVGVDTDNILRLASCQAVIRVMK